MSCSEARITVGSHDFRFLCNLYESEKEGKETGRRGQGRGDQVGKEIGWVREGKKGRGKEISQFSSFSWAVTMAPSVLKTHTSVMSDSGKGELFSSGEFVFLEWRMLTGTPLHWHVQRIENMYHYVSKGSLLFLNSYQKCQGVRTLKQVHHWDLIWGCLPLIGIDYWISRTDCYLINNMCPNISFFFF